MEWLYFIGRKFGCGGSQGRRGPGDGYLSRILEGAILSCSRVR